MESLTIGRAARAAGVNIETIRFYERRGLIAQPGKPRGGFREYDSGTVKRVRFIRQAQELGFSLREIGELLNLRTEPTADCSKVQARAERKRAEVEQKIAGLETIRAALDTLIANCPGRGALKSCTILDAIEHPSVTVSAKKPRQITTNANPDGKRRGALSGMKTIILTIEGMHCDGCAWTIQAVVGNTPGVHKVEASFDAREARVLYDPKVVTEKRIVTIIEKSGFHAKASTP